MSNSSFFNYSEFPINNINLKVLNKFEYANVNEYIFKLHKLNYNELKSVY